MAKILQICNTDFTFNHFLIPLVNGLIKSNHKIGCICYGNAINYSELNEDVEFYNVRFPKSGNPIMFIKAIFIVYKIISKGNYDIVNSHNRNASIVGRVACYFGKIHNRNLINIYTARGMYFHDAQSPLFYKLTVFIEIILSEITDLTLSQSNEDVEYLSDRKKIIPKKKIKYIANGINVIKFDPNAVSDCAFSKKNELIIATTGRIVKGKGLSDLLDAFYRVVTKGINAKLLIIGGNIAEDIEPFYDEFIMQINKLELNDHVIITGLVNNVETHLKGTDIFVLPSYREGVPRSLLEAMSMQIISIATRIRGAREIIIQNKNGFLYKPYSSDELFDLLIQVINLDDKKKKEIKINARKTVINHYNQIDYVKKQVVCFT